MGEGNQPLIALARLGSMVSNRRGGKVAWTQFREVDGVWMEGLSSVKRPCFEGVNERTGCWRRDESMQGLGRRRKKWRGKSTFESNKVHILILRASATHRYPLHRSFSINTLT